MIRHQTQNTSYKLKMKKRKNPKPFAYDLEESDLKRERRKARGIERITVVEAPVGQKRVPLLRKANAPQRADNGPHRSGSARRQKHPRKCGSLLQSLQQC